MTLTLRDAYSGVRWYLREISGESAYDRYVEPHAARPSRSAGDVAPRLRAPAAGPARGEPAGALLLSARRGRATR